MNKPSRTIKHLEQKSIKGDLASSFQLYDYYKSGRYIEQNDGKALKLIEKCESIIKKSKIKLDRVRLNNFRRFEDFEISFEPDITVIIGENGAGKSTIVDSIAKSLSWIAAFLEKDNNSGKRIINSDINTDTKALDAQIKSFYSLDNVNKFQLILSKAKQEEDQKIESKFEEIRIITKTYRTVSSQFTIEYPLFAYYGIERSNITSNHKSNIKSLDNNRINGYKNAFDDKGKLTDVSNWFIKIDNIANTEDSLNLQNELNTLRKTLKLTEDELVIDSLKKLLNLKENEYRKSLTNNSNKEYTKLRNILNDIISKLIPNVSNLEISRASGRDELLLRSFEKTVSIEQLSQGQRSVLSMVIDIVYRLTILNPHLDNPLLSQGIIVIDEIELHLHPQWQQSIIKNLREIFPNIQFIITTHSPHVLSTVDFKSIRILKNNNDNNIELISPNFQSKGISSSDILLYIMDTTLVPDIIEAKEVEQYKKYVLNHETDSDEAEKLYNKLIKHFGKDHRILYEIDDLIRLENFKKLAKKRIDNSNEKT